MPAPSRLLAITLLAAACPGDLSMADSSTSDSGTTTSATTSTSSPTTGDVACGNGQLDPGEQCDDGNQTNDDGCENDCTTTPGELCGDGMVDPGEDCDDGNTMNGDGCEDNCRVTVTPDCGDGKLDPGEQCDDSNTMSGDGCESDCTKTPMCGDGIVGPGEQCDDGNMSDEDACLGTCVPATCGDQIVNGEPKEACDDGQMNGMYGHCLADCSGAGPSCGDGTRNGPEECDDANQTDDDDCSNDCIAPRLVFVTATGFTGNLGGVVGADAKCVQEAMASSLPQGLQWLAWISDDTTTPTSPGRMDTTYGGYYKLANGAVIAHGWSALTAPPLALPINLDENGNALTEPLLAWSNTAADGVSAGADHCGNWTNAAFNTKGRFGDVEAADSAWTDAAVNNPTNCSNSFHLYCFQKAPAP